MMHLMTHAGTPHGHEADALNRSCFCLTLDRKALCAALEREAEDPEFCRTYVKPRSHLFSSVPFFLPEFALQAMQSVVSAIHEVSRLPAYREHVLSWAPDIARADPGPVGVFMGFDFHLTASGPKLIEVNTNAGGAFLNNLLARAQIACCTPMEPQGRALPGADFARDAVAMFEAEWRLQGLARPLRRIAIVDDAPEEQYLYPEFILARQMLAKAGYEPVIAAPDALQFSDGSLLHEGKPVDLVYNRLVDFALEEPRHEALRRAYEMRSTALTPNPHNHALMADKRNLVILSDEGKLEALGVPPSLRETLRAVPRTFILGATTAAEAWRTRKTLFFKPMGGHGSKGVYRGDKITRGVFEEIVKGGYVAQAFAPPGERMMRVEGVAAPRKVDVRLYAYAGKAILAAARIYQGQATNFRTPGGGFAPVFII
jgi:glutathione synthase/RimK-type ligase-like ATP-grasp enzyme